MRVAIVGAGVGGMSAALRLAKAGCTVTVLEQGERVGGKLNVWEPDIPAVGRFRFDTGPHVLTMPWAIRALFDDLGERMDDYLALERVDPICRYHFADGARFDAPADPDAAVRAIEASFPGEGAGFRRFLAHARRIHDVTIDPFLRQDFAAAIRGVPTLAQGRQLVDFLRLKPWCTLEKTVATYIQNPRLRQIFDLYAFYNGSSPAQASGIFAIIAWVQWGDGTFTLRGGLRTYADALATLADQLGVTVRLQTPVASIDQDRGRVTGVTLSSGETIAADAVVCNADPITAYRRLLPPDAAPAGLRDPRRLEPSTSAFLLLLGVRGIVPHLAHYNSFLPERADDEFSAIFERGVPADDPVIGVTCPGVTDRACAPDGYSNLFVMTSPPALPIDGSGWDAAATAAYRERLLTLLVRRCGFPSDFAARIVCEQVWTPKTFAERYGAFRGSLYGLSSNGLRASFLRPPMVSKRVRGLVFVGGGTHPGGGLPLVTLGGKLAADAVLAQRR
jgi:phytoene desaturase